MGRRIGPLPAGAGGAVTTAALAADPAGQRKSGTRDPSARASFGIPLPARVPEPGEARRFARGHTGRRAREGSWHRGVVVLLPGRANPALAGLFVRQNPPAAGATGRILRLARTAAQGWWSSGMDQAAAGIRAQSGQVQPGSRAREAPPSFTAWVAVSKDSRGGPVGAGTELWKRPRTRSRHPANYRQRGSTKELAPRTRARDRGWYRYPGCE